MEIFWLTNKLGFPREGLLRKVLTCLLSSKDFIYFLSGVDFPTFSNMFRSGSNCSKWSQKVSSVDKTFTPSGLETIP